MICNHRPVAAGLYICIPSPVHRTLECTVFSLDINVTNRPLDQWRLAIQYNAARSDVGLAKQHSVFPFTWLDTLHSATYTTRPWSVIYSLVHSLVRFKVVRECQVHWYLTSPGVDLYTNVEWDESLHVRPRDLIYAAIWVGAFLEARYHSKMPANRRPISSIES